MPLARDGGCLVATPIHVSPLRILHLWLYRKSLSGAVQSTRKEIDRIIGPRNACRRSDGGRKHSLRTNPQ